MATCNLSTDKAMHIRDKIKCAQADWIIKYLRSPVQVILPRRDYEDLLAWLSEQEECERAHFVILDGMKIYSYGGEDIVFSQEKA